jgi:hypothetical protein
MWGLLFALGIVGGLVKVAFDQTVEPTIKPAWRKRKLAKLANMTPETITLDQAEDGVVLSREFEEKKLGRKFEAIANRLKNIQRSKGKPQ